MPVIITYDGSIGAPLKARTVNPLNSQLGDRRQTCPINVFFQTLTLHPQRNNRRVSSQPVNYNPHKWRYEENKRHVYVSSESQVREHPGAITRPRGLRSNCDL